MTDLLSLLCVAATHEGDDLEDPRLAKRKRGSSQFSALHGAFTSSSSPFSVNDSSSRNRSPIHTVYSSTSSSRSPGHSGLHSPVDDRDGVSGSHTPTGSIESSSVTSYADEGSPEDTSSDDELNDPSVNHKKRKRVTKHQSRRAKPLTVDTLHQIFEILHVHKDVNGTYKLMLPVLKASDCSSKYFAVTEWQCFRKRIMNHGFEIVDEQQASWIRVRPNLQTVDGLLVFDYSDLRIRYSTPCKIKSARERGELIELPSSDTDEFVEQGSDHDEAMDLSAPCAGPSSPETRGGSSDASTSAVMSSFVASLTNLPVSPAFAALRAESVAMDLANGNGNAASRDDTNATSAMNELLVESSLRANLATAVRELVASGRYSLYAGDFDIQLTLRPSHQRTSTSPSAATVPRVSSIHGIKSELLSAAKASLA